MKKVALLYIAAVFVPSLILAWLAVRSLRDQQFLMERQQSLLYQAVADAKAKEVQGALDDCQRAFGLSVNSLLGKGNPLDAARAFDEGLRKVWPMAEVGFAVDLKGKILSPSPYSRPEAGKFCADYGRFLGNLESAEVYLNNKQSLNNSFALNAPAQSPQEQQADLTSNRRYGLNQASKLAAAEGEFRQLIGEDIEGTLARFVDNKLNVLYWCRPSRFLCFERCCIPTIFPISSHYIGVIGSLAFRERLRKAFMFRV